MKKFSEFILPIQCEEQQQLLQLSTHCFIHM